MLKLALATCGNNYAHEVALQHSIVTLCACARGKVIGSIIIIVVVIVVVSTKTAKSQKVGS